MNKWIFWPLAFVAIPCIIVYMWVRHPRKVWQEIKSSWNFVVNGKDDDRGLY